MPDQPARLSLQLTVWVKSGCDALGLGYCPCPWTRMFVIAQPACPLYAGTRRDALLWARLHPLSSDHCCRRWRGEKLNKCIRCGRFLRVGCYTCCPGEFLV